MRHPDGRSYHDAWHDNLVAKKEKNKKENLERTEKMLKNCEKWVCEEEVEKCKSDVVSMWNKEEERISDEYFDAIANGNPYEKPPVCTFLPSVPIPKKI